MSYKKRPDFINSEAAVEIRQALQDMVDNDKYSTESSYSANSAKYPDHSMSFIEKHMDYLQSHPNVNPDYYLANLKLVSKIR